MALGGLLGSLEFDFGSTLGLILVTLLLIVALYYVRIPRNLPPGPIPIPWYGSPYLFGDNIHWDFDKLAKKYGDIYTIMLGTRPTIILNSNELIREALVKRGEEFSNRPVMYCLDYMDLYDELFNHRYTQEWKDNKKAMVRILKNHGFGSPILEEPFYSNLDLLYQHYEKMDGKPFDVKESTQKLLAMTMAGLVFSGRYDSLDDKEVSELIKLALDWMASVYREGMSLGYWADNVPYQITKYTHKDMMEFMKSSTLALQNFLIKKIHEHRAEFDKENPRDIIDGYLVDRRDDPKLTDLAFSSTILMLFPDAIDTAGAYANFVILYLAYYPEWQDKVFKQILEVCGSRRPSLKDRSDMPLVEATILEVGRIQTPISVTIAHSPVKDTTLRGYFIPEDSYILGNIWAAHMDKDIFPQGENFEPMRMIDDEGKLIRNEKLLIFSAGRRMCLADQMVKNELFLYVSNTLQRFVLKLPPGEPKPSLQSVGGLVREPAPYKVCMIPRKTMDA